ncbi:MAG: hypothetical protein ACN6RG_02070 [Stenotrophomonas sp.]
MTITPLGICWIQMENNGTRLIAMGALLMITMHGCRASPSPGSMQKYLPDRACPAPGRDELRSTIFSDASNPEALWALASAVTCPSGAAQEDQKKIEFFIPSPINYVAENFPAEEGPFDREEVIASPNEVAQLIATSGLYAEYVKISIPRSDTAILIIGSDVCTLQLDLLASGNEWKVQGARNQCD